MINILFIDPPGYPLYTILSTFVASFDLPRLRLIMKDNFFAFFMDYTTSTIGWRVNHISCIFGAITAAFIALSIQQILGRDHVFNRVSSWAGSGLFAFSPCNIKYLNAYVYFLSLSLFIPISICTYIYLYVCCSYSGVGIFNCRRGFCFK